MLLPHALLWLLGCNNVSEPTTSTADTSSGDTINEPVGEVLDDVAWLARVSLDLRGVRPSVAELEAVQADPEAIYPLIDEMLDDDRFPERMALLWNESVHTAVWGAGYTRFEWDFETWRAIGWEPLAVIELVLRDGRPFSDIVTATETPMQAALAEAYGLSAVSEGWEWGSYSDDRPMAGMLSTNALWMRYTADSVNYNRTRANTVASIFLCSDFLEREGGFDFDINPAELTEIENAVRTQPACLSCHAALDPLARFFGGFAEKSDSHPQSRYVHYSAHEHLANLSGGEIMPHYFGHPGEDIRDLGAYIAADPRFYQCATERFFAGLTRQDIDDTTRDSLARSLWESGDARELVYAIVTSETYRSTSPRLMSSAQLYTAISDLGAWDPGTGLEEGLKALAYNPELRVLAGGTDDITVLQRNERFGVGLGVVLAWGARQMSFDALNTDLSRSERILLDVAELDSTDEATVRAQLAAWHTRFLSRPVTADSPEIDALYTLWVAFDEQTDLHPWPQTLSALVRHPQMVMY